MKKSSKYPRIKAYYIKQESDERIPIPRGIMRTKNSSTNNETPQSMIATNSVLETDVQLDIDFTEMDKIEIYGSKSLIESVNRKLDPSRMTSRSKPFYIYTITLT